MTTKFETRAEHELVSSLSGEVQYFSLPLSLYPSIYLSLPPSICSNQGHVVRIRIASYVVWIWAEAKQGFGTNSVVIVGDTDTTHGYI